MSIQDVDGERWRLTFDLGVGRAVVVEPVAEQISSDAGLLPIRQFDEQWRLTAGFGEQLQDRRRAASTEHRMLEMVRMRVYGILAGYEDQNDHDALRSDAVFKLVAGRLPDDDDLASQPTLSRFENSITAGMLLQIEHWFLEQFADDVARRTHRPQADAAASADRLEADAAAPSADRQPFAGAATPLSNTLTLDLDVFDDATHGQQQLTFFHGFYEQYQYLVRAFTCADNDQVILPVLLYGTAHATLGAGDDVRRVVTRLRQEEPGRRIHLRADSGFATPSFYEACERCDLEYSIGLAMNSVLKRRSDATLQAAQQRFQETGQAQRLFTAFEYQAGSWPGPRWVIVKCEANAQGTNRRAIVTNRPGARVLPEAAYDAYAERGESENRNKELKCELSADRLSDHRYLANSFRMFLHCLAHNLLVRVRRALADPPQTPPLRASCECWLTGSCQAALPPPALPSPSAAPSPQPSAARDDPMLSKARPCEPGSDHAAPEQASAQAAHVVPPAHVGHVVPPEAFTGRRRRQRFNQRRQADPLGEGHACTWRLRLIKVAARIRVSARRVFVQLSGSWPFLEHYEHVGLSALPPPAPSLNTS